MSDAAVQDNPTPTDNMPVDQLEQEIEQALAADETEDADDQEADDENDD